MDRIVAGLSFTSITLFGTAVPLILLAMSPSAVPPGFSGLAYRVALALSATLILVSGVFLGLSALHRSVLLENQEWRYAYRRN